MPVRIGQFLPRDKLTGLYQNVKTHIKYNEKTMIIAGYLNQLLRNGQFWFLKESALELWMSNKNPQALPYLAVAYDCLHERHIGIQWLQECRQSLSADEQRELAESIGRNAPANAAPRIRMILRALIT